VVLHSIPEFNLAFNQKNKKKFIHSKTKQKSLYAIADDIMMQVRFDQEEDLNLESKSLRMMSLALSASPLAGKASKLRTKSKSMQSISCSF
jgi:hypothetical protein